VKDILILTIPGVLSICAFAVGAYVARKAQKPPLPNIDVGVAFPVLMDGKEVEVIVDTINGDVGPYGRQVRIQLQDAKSWSRERRI
jgi:hypothetical protein